ncbi:hypothetical protein H310_06420 [Aphanomyces invadans]|uniref:Radial spoke 3 n=1 Tax=Aphanomyces invadans TaxID=157072 RepID=A0A024U6L4_9STRA|nr:hypothetical protein H310_06420 [Aphanomyces invadans]ETW01850.1 hypothetical protein H310_06420 [Aphanomyces invadans]|eukprot:XP_008869698.1 hypothetical protein H310_06420 [Aphanomyces invadans]
MDDLQYSFAAKPRAVQNARGKHREKKAKPSNAVFNIMNDPRVARGSVYAAANSIHIKRENAARVSQLPPNQRSSTQKPFKMQAIFDTPTSLQTYFPVDLTANLIEPSPHVDETEVSTQTDSFLPNDKHKKPFVLKKTGVDVSTEIAEADNLFDFDEEVAPLLTVLVNKTLKQALCEVEWEEELKYIALYLEELHTNKALDAEAVRELVAQARKAYAIKGAEKIEQRRRQEEFNLVDEKVAAASLSRVLLNQVMEDATAALTDQGVFYDPLRRQVENNFMPWMYSTANTVASKKQTARRLVEDVVGATLHHQQILRYIASLHTHVQENSITLPVGHRPAYGLEGIGPIPFSPVGRDLDKHIDAWVQANAPHVARPPLGFLADLAGIK